MYLTNVVTATRIAVPDTLDDAKVVIDRINQLLDHKDLALTIRPLDVLDYVDEDGYYLHALADDLVTIWEFCNFLASRVGYNQASRDLEEYVSRYITGTDTADTLFEVEF